MIRKTARILFIVPGLVFLGTGHAPHAQNDVRVTGTYTDMYYNEEAGDVLGEELKIVDTRGGHYQGALQFADGEPGPLILVNINVSGKHVSFAMPDIDSNGGSFSGTLEKGLIRGDFQFKQGAVKNVVLKKGKSYWD
jgi:hypothetical protein